MTREEKTKAFEMYLDGFSLTEIADSFGVSKQWISVLLGGKSRKSKSFRCVFPELRKWIFEHRLSINRFNDNAKVCNHVNTLRRKIVGEHEFTLPEIKAILAYTGMTFEEAFVKVEDAPGDDTHAD